PLQFGGGVLVGIGIAGAGHRLLRGVEFGGRRRRGGAGRGRQHASEHQRLQWGPEVCEACRHWGAAPFTECRGHCRQPAPDTQRSRPAIGDSYMDIGYFLKLMTEKNASDMFLTTGAPVYIKVE